MGVRALLSGKKIGVVTPYDSNNYGAYLQAFATKCILEGWGADVAFLEFRSRDQRLKLFDKKLGKRIPADYEPPNKFLTFEKAWARLDVESGPIFYARDAFVIGSDEIWNIKKPLFNLVPAFFGLGMRNVVAYAPSVGSTSPEDLANNSLASRGIRGLDSILVRDEAGADAVEIIAGKRPEVVLDPTLLINWDDVGSSEPFELPDSPYLLVYAYNEKALPVDAIKKYAQEHGLKVISAGFSLPFCDESLIPDPLSFYQLMKHASAVVTTTFHGSIFALLSKAQFVSIPTSPKTVHLLEKLGLSGRMIQNGKSKRSSALLPQLLQKAIDYDSVYAVLEKERELSLSLYSRALQNSLCKPKDDRRSIELVVEGGRCTGCFACKNSCSVGAISVSLGMMGATVPAVDHDICVSCGKCDRVCPAVAGPCLGAPIETYAAWAKEGERNQASSSGGVGYLLAKQCIDKGGVVFGAAFDGLALRHRSASTVEEAQAFCGSKYLQSDVADIYAQVKADLKKGALVSFFGTPCQVSGLRAYLGKDYDNLLLVDLICHGVPPAKLFEEHVKTVCPKYYQDIDNISFRDGTFSLRLMLPDGKVVYDKHRDNDAYYHAFMEGYSYRESCYSCPYAASNRVGDLTLGDFWGLDRSALTEDFQGPISVVLAMTEKGVNTFEALEDSVHAEKASLSAAVKGNPQLRRPSLLPLKASDFRQRLESQAFEEAFRQSRIWRSFMVLQLKTSPLGRVARAIKRAIRK